MSLAIITIRDEGDEIKMAVEFEPPLVKDDDAGTNTVIHALGMEALVFLKLRASGASLEEAFDIVSATSGS